MSTQRGNTSKSKPQKHKNTSAYKNDMHNKSKKMATINSTTLPGLCQRCKEVIEWKIKYGKYKPLTVPRKCNRCHEKTVKQAYYTVCLPCGNSAGVCCKCAEKKEVVEKPGLSAAEQASEDSRLEGEIRFLTERQRRSFFRLQEKGELSGKLLEAKAKSGEDQDDSDDQSDDQDNDSELSHSEGETENTSYRPLEQTSTEDTDVDRSQAEVCGKVASGLTLAT